MAKQRRVKGSVLEIKLENGYYAYAQDLGEGVVFFDFFLIDPISDLDQLKKVNKLFIVAIYNYPITSGRWKKVGKIPIGDEYANLPLKFIQDGLNPKLFSLYNPNNGEITDATREECEGLECASVWGADHVEDRLRDYINGVPNVWVEQLAIK
jgi:hypothetical protein